MKDKLNLKIVHVDDDPIEIMQVEKILCEVKDDVKFNVLSLRNPAEYRLFLHKEHSGRPPNCVILDVHLEDEGATGIDLARETKKVWPSTAVIIRTTDRHSLQDALPGDADDFIDKHSFEGELRQRIIKVVDLVKERVGDVDIKNLRTQHRLPVVGETMVAIAHRIERIVGSAVRAIHVFGESGTGKEVVADIFNELAGDGTPFVRVNCGAIAEKLFESELFGSVKGAYTGALKDRMGLVEQANHGFLFLDEIASIPHSCQVKLLRLIDNQECKRVGDSHVRSVDVRVITATNENLQDLVDKKSFRNDLYQRMREAEINLSPLRKRPNEIPDLIDHFCRTINGGPYQVTDSTRNLLQRYDWREGNVRELRNCIRAMTENHLNKLLTPITIPESFWRRLKSQSSDIADDITPDTISGKKLLLSWDGEEIPAYDKLADFLLIEMIRKAQRKTGRNSLRSIESVVGLSRTALSERLRGMVHKNILTAEDLKNLVGLNM